MDSGLSCKTETGDNSGKLFVAKVDILSLGFLTSKCCNSNTRVQEELCLPVHSSGVLLIPQVTENSHDIVEQQ